MPSSIASPPRAARRLPAPIVAARAALAAALLAACAAPALAQPIIDSGGVSQRLPAQLPPSEAKTANDAYQAAARQQRAGDPEGALATLEQALRAVPRDVRLRFLRGVLLAELGRRREAIDAFETLVADFPELPEPYNNLAVLHASGGDLDRARAALEQAIRALPDYGLARENLGDVYLRMAAREYELALRVEPGSRSAQQKLTLAQELVKRIAPAAAASAASPAR